MNLISKDGSIITLEFHEEGQHFHYNWGDDPENTFGYRTVAKNCDRSMANMIIQEAYTIMDNQRLSFNDITWMYKRMKAS